MNVADFDYVRKFVRESSAIILEPGKEYLVESRLLTLAQKEKINSIETLTGLLRKGERDLHRKVVEAMTTNETSFFRDIHPFEALKNTILPELIAKRAKERRLTIWCGASSTGQEPYSLLMLIAQHFPDLYNWEFKFIATDLSDEVLARAKSGKFSQLEVNRGLPSQLLVKHFKRVGTEWEIEDRLKNRVHFMQLNLVKPWPVMPLVDLVMLRNVMIYFDLDAKRAILSKVQRLLRPGGYLMLGSAETTLNINEAFDRKVYDKTTCYQLKAA